MSSPLRASNEGLLRPRVARAQGTHRAILPPAGGLFQHPAETHILLPVPSVDVIVVADMRHLGCSF